MSTSSTTLSPHQRQARDILECTLSAASAIAFRFHGPFTNNAPFIAASYAWLGNKLPSFLDPDELVCYTSPRSYKQLLAGSAVAGLVGWYSTTFENPFYGLVVEVSATFIGIGVGALPNYKTICRTVKSCLCYMARNSANDAENDEEIALGGSEEMPPTLENVLRDPFSDVAE